MDMIGNTHISIILSFKGDFFGFSSKISSSRQLREEKGAKFRNRDPVKAFADDFLSFIF